MDRKEKLNTRHLEANSKLKSIAEPVIAKSGLMKCAKIISVDLNISDQTVLNYLDGRGKDGFLTEAISDVFSQL